MQSWQLFIRHAHRDVNDREADNGLSEKGLKQGRDLVRYLLNFGDDRKATQILSSPKLRCRQTAEFASQWAGVPVEIDERLDEQGPWESNTNFLKRIETFYEWCRARTKLCLVSHGDVLPLIAKLACDSTIEVKKGDLFWLIEGQIRELNAVHSSGNDRR
jgi:broad specificity phosphatase PhoE